jgi:predicted dehydrogenase
MVGQNYRYMRAFRTVKAFVESGRLGRLGSVQCEYYRPPHDMPVWLTAMDDSLLWGAAVHHLDAIRYIAGGHPRAVIGDRFSDPGGEYRPGASLRLFLELGGGVRVTYFGTYEARGHEFFEGGQRFAARFSGDRGTLHVWHRWLIWCETGRWPRLIGRGRRRHSEERVLLDKFATAIETGAEPESSGRDNLQTMAILEAYRRSIGEKQWIDPQALLAGAGVG